MDASWFSEPRDLDGESVNHRVPAAGKPLFAEIPCERDACADFRTNYVTLSVVTINLRKSVDEPEWHESDRQRDCIGSRLAQASAAGRGLVAGSRHDSSWRHRERGDYRLIV
jgi:hypothetical protein